MQARIAELHAKARAEADKVTIEEAHRRIAEDARMKKVREREAAEAAAAAKARAIEEAKRAEEERKMQEAKAAKEAAARAAYISGAEPEV